MRGTLLQVLGAALMVAAFVAFFILQYFRGTHALVPDREVYAVGLPIICVLLVAGSAWYSTGRKISAKTAQAAAAQDLRPPVLYLRSFPDDPKAADGPQFTMPTGGAVGGMLMSFVGAVTTEEEQLAKAMGDIGPFIAIGKPGEKLPELGAARLLRPPA